MQCRPDPYLSPLYLFDPMIMIGRVMIGYIGYMNMIMRCYGTSLHTSLHEILMSGRPQQ